MMPSIYLRKETKKKLYEFINSSRLSPDFGAKKKYPIPDKAIEFLLKIGLNLPLKYLEGLASMYDEMESGKISGSEEELDKIDENLREKLEEKENEDNKKERKTETE